MKQIEVRALRKDFNEKKILDNINFSVDKGELMCLLGPSGCGKSTTLKIIAGLLKEDSGEVYLGGKSMKTIPPEKREAVIVFQEYSLFPHLNVYENIAFGLKMRKKNKNYIKDKVYKITNLLRLEGLEHKYPHNLSGGQKQRVAIGRALAIEPKILLLDEPFTSLDINVKNTIRELVLNIQKKIGITTILVTHDKEEGLMMADNIALMFKGKIAQYGTPKDIYENPNSKEVANFFGERNFIKGIIKENKFYSDLGEFSVETEKIGEVEAIINPEDISILNKEEKGYLGYISNVKYLGDRSYYVIHYKNSDLRVMDYSKKLFRKGDKVYFYINFHKAKFLK